jgi:hypothetical protein
VTEGQLSNNEHSNWKTFDQCLHEYVPQEEKTSKSHQINLSKLMYQEMKTLLSSYFPSSSCLLEDKKSLANWFDEYHSNHLNKILK